MLAKVHALWLGYATVVERFDRMSYFISIHRLCVSAGSINENIAKSIVDLSRTLKLSLTVERIENDWQLGDLSALGCDRFQGYFFTRPLAESVCLNLILSTKRECRFAA